MSSQNVTESVLSYIEEHPDSADGRLSLDKIAEELNYSKFYLARAFKENTGITLYQYIRSRRLNEAARQLALSKKPITEIALEAGYSSQQAFTQAFHQEYLHTPQEYRRNGILTPGRNRIEMLSAGSFMPFKSEMMGGGMAA